MLTTLVNLWLASRLDELICTERGRPDSQHCIRTFSWKGQASAEVGVESTLVARDGKHLVAVCRIKPLRRLRCCALPVFGFGEEGAELSLAPLMP